MSGWDAEQITSLNLGRDRPAADGSSANDRLSNSFSSSSRVQSISASLAEDRFRQFLRTFSLDERSTFKYREELKQNFAQGQFYVAVELVHLHSFDAELYDLVMEQPMEYMPLFESAATQVARAATGSTDLALDEEGDAGRELDTTFLFRHQRVQVQLISHASRSYRASPGGGDKDEDDGLAGFSIRHLSSSQVSKIVQFRGIVVSAGRPRVKPIVLSIRCKICGSTKEIHASSGFGGTRIPRKCDTQAAPGQRNQCGLDSYEIEPDLTQYVDQQRLKLQELTEQVSTGELPRHVSLACDRYLVGTVKPGARVLVTGVYTTYEMSGGSSSADGAGVTDKGIRIPYVRVYGLVQNEDTRDGMGAFSGDLASLGMSDDNHEDLIELSQRDDIYDQITNSMCPAIFDNEDTRNIKRALAVQLFGGCSKSLTDGMRLRGDINMLLLGDPSVAKSQFLKFVSGVAPIGVYTSGKGSSAAGLTASVVKDPGSGEFHLEGGALVLADGGLVCIDEFDKMREQDRVAIHEAMEQQTISIAKAGITTILNSRTAVLAAANPIFGRYDDARSPTENIDFQTSILSRFDLIFIVRDIQDEQRDSDLARHVLNVHRYKQEAINRMQQDAPMIDIDTLKRYIAHARATCHPRLTPEAAQTLKNRYVAIRQQVRGQGASSENKVIPITVRQLEAVIRISEALARMELLSTVESRHVEEALRLFQVSTLRAATSGGSHNASTSSSTGGPVVGGAAFDAQVKEAERAIAARMIVGSTLSKEQLVAHLEQKNIARMATEQALTHMAARNQVAFMKMRKLVKRLE